MTFVVAALALAAPTLTVEGYAPGEVLRYPVALVRGATLGAEVQLQNLDHPKPDGNTQAQVREGRYLGLIELRPGRNRIRVRSERGVANFDLRYEPSQNPNRVRMVWAVASDGDTRYLTDRENDPQDYAAKLSTAAKLMQTFTAEALNDLGLGRRTFTLEFDAQGDVVVHRVRYPMPASELRTRDGGRLWGDLYGLMDRKFGFPRNRAAVVMAFTDLDPTTGRARAHTALGGGGLALFGGGGVSTWPSSIRTAQAAFSDARMVDPKRVVEDSAGRGSAWSNASTGIGATLHELGHTLGMPHINDPFCVMSRGFDHFQRRFVLWEAPSRRHPEGLAFKENERARWSPFFAHQLAVSRWFAFEDPGGPEAPGPEIAYDRASGRFQASSPHGLRFLGAYRHRNGDVVQSVMRDPGGAKAMVWELAGESAALSEKLPLMLVAVDGRGNRRTVEVQ